MISFSNTKHKRQIIHVFFSLSEGVLLGIVNFNRNQTIQTNMTIDDGTGGYKHNLFMSICHADRDLKSSEGQQILRCNSFEQYFYEYPRDDINHMDIIRFFINDQHEFHFRLPAAKQNTLSVKRNLSLLQSVTH